MVNFLGMLKFVKANIVFKGGEDGVVKFEHGVVTSTLRVVSLEKLTKA